MLAIDTNVLVRFLVEDDESQSRRAHALVRKAVAQGESLWVSELVLAELVWVLHLSYRLQRNELSRTLASLFAAEHLAFEQPDRLSRVLRAFDAGKGDLADYLIREQAKDAGCAALATFDRALQREPGFTRP